MSTNNLGIKSILNPVKKNTADNSPIIINTDSESVNYQNLITVWKDYALKLKRNNKNSLYSTINSIKPKISAELKISIDINNTIAAQEFEAIKPDFTAFLRNKLKNGKITLEYSIVKSDKIEFNDSKTKFEKLLKENSSLEKFRKLFNLDIEY